MWKKWLTTRSLCLGGVIAALYAALTLLLAPLSYGPIQLRLSEAMTLLPLLFPQAVPGLFIGCLIANLYTGSLLDILFGSLATLLAALGTRWLRAYPLLAAACPVVCNGLIVGAVLSISGGLPLALTVGQIALGETGAVLIGLGLLGAIRRNLPDASKQ